MLAWNCSIRRSSFAKHLPQVAYERIRLLMCGEVSALAVSGLEHQFTNVLGPSGANVQRQKRIGSQVEVLRLTTSDTG